MSPVLFQAIPIEYLFLASLCIISGNITTSAGNFTCVKTIIDINLFHVLILVCLHVSDITFHVLLLTLLYFSLLLIVVNVCVSVCVRVCVTVCMCIHHISVHQMCSLLNIICNCTSKWQSYH